MRDVLEIIRHHLIVLAVCCAIGGIIQVFGGGPFWIWGPAFYAGWFVNALIIAHEDSLPGGWDHWPEELREKIEAERAEKAAREEDGSPPRE